MVEYRVEIDEDSKMIIFGIKLCNILYELNKNDRFEIKLEDRKKNSNFELKTDYLKEI